VNDCVAVQPFASVTVTVYEPAISPVAVEPVPPEGDHAYVYAPVPPDAITDAEPVFPPLHNTFVCVPAVVIAVGCVMVKVFVVVQPFASVVVHVYVPAHNAVAVEPVPPTGAHA
jgi:hypothetical protein